MEKTLALIKPDATEQNIIGEIITMMEAEGFKIAAMKMLKLTKKQAEAFYYVHCDKPFFQSLTDFMCSGPLVAIVLQGENVITRYRTLMGATNYREADEGTIRKAYATEIEKNAVHGSDSPASASFEIGFFFNHLEAVL